MEEVKNTVKTQEQIDDEQFPATEYAKKQYSFSVEELAELKPLEDVKAFLNTLLTLGAIAQRAEDSYVVNNVMKRLGVKESPDVKVNYDLSKKNMIVYEPRFWCISCGNKKATHKYQDKTYCQSCIETLKEQSVKKEEKKTKKA